MREVGWAQSSAMLVRREAAEEVGWLDPDFFVYSDETDFCKRLRDAGWRILFVPAARGVHHDQLSTDAAAMRRRIVEFHRGRDLYFRKHGMPLTRLAVDGVLDLGLPGAARPRRRCCPGDDPRRYLLHARQQLPSRARRGHPRGGRGATTAAATPERTLAAAERGHLRCPRRWSTRTPPNSPRSAARSGRCSCCSRAGASRCSPGLVVLAVRRGRTRRRRSGRRPLDKLGSAAGAGRGRARPGCSWARPRRCSPAGRRSCRVAVLLAAPVPPAARLRQLRTSFLVSVAEDGRLGRLLPLYFVLAAAGAGARLARAARRRAARRCRALIALPAAAFFAFAFLSLLWADDLEAGANLLAFFTLPFAALLATVARAEFPDACPARLAVAAIGARLPLRRGRALAGASRTSSSSTRPTSRSRTRTRTSSASPRCSATRACTAATWCSASGVVLALLAAAAVATVAAASPRWSLMWAGPAVLLLAVEHGGAAGRDARAGLRHRRPPGAAGRGGCWPLAAAWSARGSWR